MMVITGGQTGVDQAAWRAAKALGISTGGWMPIGFRTEDSKHPEFEELYGAKEAPTSRKTVAEQYRARTSANVDWGSATLWYNPAANIEGSPGYYATKYCCERDGKQFYVVGDPKNADDVPALVEAIATSNPETIVLNIAGSRESRWPGIGKLAQAYFEDVFRQVLQRWGWFCS